MRAYLLIMLAAAAVTFVGTYLVLKLAHKYKIYPQIRSRDVHTKPTPRLGGIAMFAGFLITVTIAGFIGWFRSVYAEPLQIVAIVSAAFLITVIGFLDDLYDLDWSLKLAGQFVVAGILAWQGVQIVSLPIAGLTIGSFGISFIATVFLTVLVMNAVNFIDGLDGLVAGVVFIGTSVFFGLLSVAMGFTTNLIVFYILFFIIGLAVPSFFTSAMTLLQETVEPERQGRVFGFVGIVISVAMPIGMAVLGPLADVYPVESLMIVSGMAMVVFALGAVLLPAGRKAVAAAQKSSAQAANAEAPAASE